MEQSVELSRALEKEGADPVNVSPGGNYIGQKVPLVPGYQVSCCGLDVGALC